MITNELVVYSGLSATPRLMLQSLSATLSGSDVFAFHHDRSSPTWWFCRWHDLHRGTVNSSLTLSPIPRGWANLRW